MQSRMWHFYDRRYNTVKFLSNIIRGFRFTFETFEPRL